MNEYGSMLVADSLKTSWVDGEGKSIMTGKSLRGATSSPVEIVIPERVVDARITALETEIALLRNSLIALSDKVLSLEFPLQDAPQSVTKTKKVKK